MDERMKFIALLLDGESMTRACQQLGVSRKTGYKIWNRYQNTGAYALVDRSRKPHRFANQLPEQLERTLLKLKKQKPHWGHQKSESCSSESFPIFALLPSVLSMRFWTATDWSIAAGDAGSKLKERPCLSAKSQMTFGARI